MKETRPTAYRYRHRRATWSSDHSLSDPTRPLLGVLPGVLTRDLTQTKPVLIQLRKKATNLPGGLPYESDRDVRWKIKIKP